MATSQYFLNRYQRTLANKPRLLQQRIAIESDISKKKYDADIKMLEKQIGFVEGAAGMGIDYYDYKKGAGSEASLGDFLGDRIEQSLGIGSEDSEVNKTIGTQREERIASRKTERKESGQGMFGGYVDNLKGFLTRPLTNPATNETLGRLMPTREQLGNAYENYLGFYTNLERQNMSRIITDNMKRNPNRGNV